MPPSRDDAAVFTEIFDEHRHAVHAYFLGRVADPELARDLVQETFLRAWRRLSGIAPLPADGHPAGPAGRPGPRRPRPGTPRWPGHTGRPRPASAWPGSTPPSASSRRSSG